MKDEITTYISQIDSLLSQGKYDEISALFTDEFVRDIDCDELAYISLYVFIYREERDAGIRKTSFSYGKNIAELVEVFRRLKFYLWRLEFTDETVDCDKTVCADSELRNNETGCCDESSELLSEFIMSYGITIQFLKMAVMTSSADKELIIKKLSQIL